jgi:1-acyl-sn-glycerol-3-phosphate acyltransferase
MNLRYILVMTLTGVIRLVCGASSRWLAPLSAEGQHIYFANHTSNLDAVVLWSALPPDIRMQTRPVAARDYWEKNRIRRFLATRVFNAVLIQRAGHSGEAGSAREVLSTFNNMVEAIGTDASLIIFPEGMRGDGEQVLPFKAGIYHIAKRRPEVKFVPAYIENLGRILPKHEIMPVPLLTTVSFGLPMRLEEAETKQQFLDRARGALIALRDQSC